MKKVLAIMFALVLMLSFAACGDKDDATTTTVAPVATLTPGTPVVPQQTQLAGQAVIPAQTQAQVVTPIETQAQIVTPVTPAAGTVEQWLAANQAAVDAFCAENSNESSLASITAQGNTLIATETLIFDEDTLDLFEGDMSMITESYVEDAAEQQAEFDAMSAEEKAEGLSAFASEIEESIGVTGMPAVDSIIMNVVDGTTGTIIATVTFSK